MKRIVLLACLFSLVFAFAATVQAQTPEIEEKMARVNELRDQMANTTDPEEYDKIKTEFETLKKEVEQLLASIQADKEAKARAIQLYNKGNSSLRSRQYDSAIRDFREAAKLNPLEPKIQFSLGRAYQAKKDYTSALGAYDMAVQLDPSYVKALNAKGLLLSRMKQLDKAVAAFQQAVAVTDAPPKDISKGFTGLGLAYYRQQKFDQAISAYTQAVTVNPQNDEAYFNMAKVEAEKKNYQAAVDALQKAVDIDRKNHKYLTALAEKYNRLGQYSNAATNAQAATGVNGRYAAAWFELGWAFENMGKKDEAIAAYEKAMNDRNYRASAEYQIKTLRGEH